MDSILVVEDEKKISEVVCDYLKSLGYDVAASFTGTDAVAEACAKNFSLMILDLMLPGLDGIEVIKRVRRQKQIPAIMLTARDSEADKLLGFEVGADDYMTKPFSIRELGARVRAVLHRYESFSQPADANHSVLLEKGDVELDCGKRTVKKNGKEVLLTSAQFDLLKLFFDNPGHAFSRKELIEKLSGYDYEGYERTIDVHIKNIRKAIEDNPSEPALLLTVWGYGYKLSE